MQRTEEHPEDTGDLDARLGELLGEVEQAADDLGEGTAPPGAARGKEDRAPEPARTEAGEQDLEEAIDSLLEGGEVPGGGSQETGGNQPAPDREAITGEGADLSLESDIDALLAGDAGDVGVERDGPAEGLDGNEGAVSAHGTGEESPTAGNEAPREPASERPLMGALNEGAAPRDAESLDEELAGIAENLLDQESEEGDRAPGEAEVAAGVPGQDEEEETAQKAEAPPEPVDDSPRSDSLETEQPGGDETGSAVSTPSSPEPEGPIRARETGALRGRLRAVVTGIRPVASGMGSAARDVCAFLSRPAQGLDPLSRQAIGWFGLMTLFWALVIFVYAVFIRSPEPTTPGTLEAERRETLSPPPGETSSGAPADDSAR